MDAHAAKPTTGATTEQVVTHLGPLPVRIWDGAGPTVVASHPVLTDGRFWEPLAAALAGRLRLVAPDLPLGAHRRPVADRARLGLTGVADALMEVADAVSDESVLLVGNDTGGAVAQIAVARHPTRVAGLVLAPCEVLEHCPPRPFRPVMWLITRPAGARWLVRLFRRRPVLATPGPLNLLTRRGVSPELVASWTSPGLGDDAITRDLTAVLATVRREPTRAAAEVLASWPGRIALVWGRRGQLFPPRDGRRFAGHVGADPVRWLDGVGALAAWDRPDVVAEVLVEMAARHDAERGAGA